MHYSCVFAISEVGSSQAGKRGNRRLLGMYVLYSTVLYIYVCAYSVLRTYIQYILLSGRQGGALLHFDRDRVRFQIDNYVACRAPKSPQSCETLI
jgi:hypothetical protein